MTDAIVIAESGEKNAGYRFSWGLAIAGGIAATAVTFFLLTLGSGFGLFLAGPVTHADSVAPSFLVGGAVYFFVAQAFGFAVGGHLAGRLLGPTSESSIQEEFRAAAHGLIAWSVTVLATLVIVAMATTNAVNGAGSAAALYGSVVPKSGALAPSAYFVDTLYRPIQRKGVTYLGNDTGLEKGRAETARLIDVALANGGALNVDDRGRLVELTSTQTGLSPTEAANRVDHVLSDIGIRTVRAVEIARKTASYTSLWIAASLLFGAIVAMLAAVTARLEDDRDAVRN